MSLEIRVVSENGYVVVEDDLDFLSIGRDSFGRWANRESPLTIARDDYVELCASLFEALEADGIHDADVRIQGSSVNFFSSRLKPMPYDQGALVSEFLKQYSRLPSQFETDRMMARLASRWAEHGPSQRPFDAMFIIGAAREASDLDFQVSSEDVRKRLEEQAQSLGTNLAAIRAINPDYNFFIKELTESEFRNLSLWRIRAMDLIRRPVSVAMFDGGGPPRFDSAVSSHFKEEDWRVTRFE